MVHEFHVPEHEIESFEEAAGAIGMVSLIGWFEDDSGGRGQVYLADCDVTAWLYLSGYYHLVKR